MKSFIEEKRTGILVSLGVTICVLSLMLASCISYNYAQKKSVVTESVDAISYYSNVANTTNELYLSDMTPIKKQIGWGELKNDSDTNGNLITLKVENNWFSFKKGVFAHATSTLVYDLTSYEDNYKYFTAFIGLNSSAATSSNGVTYHFSISKDNNIYTEVGKGIKKKPAENATYVEIPLNEAKYLKIYITDDGGNGNDHSVLADAKFTSSLENNFVIGAADDYNSEIKSKYTGQTDITGDLEFTLLKRELIKRVGQYTINSFYNESAENKATVDWLMENQKVLKDYILGGEPDGGSYYNSLTVLSQLYNAKYEDIKLNTTTDKYVYTQNNPNKYIKNDIKDTTLTNNKWYPNLTKGEVYQKMMISLSLTHSTAVGYWAQIDHPSNRSDALERYRIFKYLYDNGKFKVSDRQDQTPWFEALQIEEMRYIMNSIVDNEEIIWFNEYTQTRIDAHPNQEETYLQPHTYIAYVWPNFQNPIYHDPANYEYFDDLFDGIFSKYGVTYSSEGNMVYKAWMSMRNKWGTGAVCGGISKLGTHIRAAHGTPASVISQPGHAAIIYYRKNANGTAYWTIDNDVSGWAQSGKTERLSIRMPLGWGNDSYVSGWAATYIVLAQEAMNDWTNYEKSAKLIMLADVYKDDAKKQEELYRKALEVQKINIDAWWEIIKLYNNDSTKTEEDYYNLAKEMGDALLPFPLPLYNLYAQLKGKFTSTEYMFKFTLLQNKVLNEEKSYTGTDVLQPAIVRTVGTFLLGQTDTSLATFSFDGDNAGKIKLSSRFDGNGVRWDYNISGKDNQNGWKEVFSNADEEHSVKLTSAQIASLTADNDIYVHIVGTDYSDDNIYKIDLTQGALLSTIYANDLENRVVGVNTSTEWRYTTKDKWTSYSVSSPDLTGNKTVQVRQAATGTKLASEPSEMFTFTADNQPDTRKYVSSSHLSIVSVSTEATGNGGHATNAIDANYNTRYHSNWNGQDTERYMVIKLDTPMAISSVEFVPAGGGNGKIYDGTIYGSSDGENWKILTSAKNLSYFNQANTVADAILNTKSFDIENPELVQYVKIVADRTNGNWFTARAFNFYQDITKNPQPTAGIAYSTTEKTNEKVIARLVNASTSITITNNNGSDSYTFSENGNFTFEFVDANGKTGSAIASVNWIDKDIPTADVEYELDSNNKLVISLDAISEDVYLLDASGKKVNYVEVDNGTVSSVSYLDTAGKDYKTVYVDNTGSIEKIAYKNTSNRVTSVASYVTNVQNGVVTSEEYYDDEGNNVTPTTEDKETLKSLQQSIANPLEYTFEKSGDYEFKMLDKASNIAYKSIKANYVDNTVITSDITYDITDLTNQSVTATINAYVLDENGAKQDAVVMDSENTYVFLDNGKFTFRYKDANDTVDYNVKEHTAEVTWIDKVAPTAEVTYKTLDNGNVVATLTKESETIIITNNGGSREYTFTKNGNFTFTFEDKAGNETSLQAVVNSIQEETNKPVEEVKQEPVTPSDTNTNTSENNVTNSIVNTPSNNEITSSSTPSVSTTTTIPIYTPSSDSKNNSSTSSNSTTTNKNNTTTNNTNSSTTNPSETSKEDTTKDKTETNKPSTNKEDKEEIRTEVNAKENNLDTFKKYTLGIILAVVLLVGIIVVKTRKNGKSE